MLTRDDLQQIRGVIREEVKIVGREEIRGIVREEVALQLKPVNLRLDRFERKLNRLQKDMTLIVHDYSNAILGLRNRVEKIEKHLHLSDK